MKMQKSILGWLKMGSVNVIRNLSQIKIISGELNALLDETNIMQNMVDKCDNANAKSARLQFAVILRKSIQRFKSIYML